MSALPSSDLGTFERLARTAPLVPVWREVRGDTETPVSAFLKLRAGRHGFLLESVEGGERWRRYSFLGDRPLAILTLRGRTSVLKEDGRSSFTEEDRPIEAAGRLLARLGVARDGGLPRPVGGLLGYLGYGAARWFEPRVPERHGPDPDFPDGEWMLPGRLVVFDNLSHRLRLVTLARPDRHRTARQAFDHAAEEVDRLAAALAGPLPPPPADHAPEDVEEVWPRPGFERAVERAREHIRAGDCMQVVLSRRVTARWEGEPFELYRALRSVAPTPFLFYLRFDDRALAGASPELLTRVEDGRVTVRPIAGTRRRGATETEDAALDAELRADPKERAEHVMLVDLGRNDVGRVSVPGTVRVEERDVVERYSHVMHLVSQVSGRLREGLGPLDALAATFPAGTVSGAPKVRAMEIIDALEPATRGPYAGAAGWIGTDAMDLAITIRALALSGTRLRFQAGAGIVHDSDPGREYDETVHKLRSTLRALGARDPGEG